ncbi:unnamed protein product [Closterium sp. NIES-53]
MERHPVRRGGHVATDPILQDGPRRQGHVDPAPAAPPPPPLNHTEPAVSRPQPSPPPSPFCSSHRVPAPPPPPPLPHPPPLFRPPPRSPFSLTRQHSLLNQRSPRRHYRSLRAAPPPPRVTSASATTSAVVSAPPCAHPALAIAIVRCPRRRIPAADAAVAAAAAAAAAVTCRGGGATRRSAHQRRLRAAGFSGEGVFAKREKKQQKKRPNQAQQQEQQEEAEEKLPSNHVQLFDQEEQEGGGTEQESGAAATRPFLELEWYSEQYDLEKHLMEMLMRRTDNPVRTTDPEQASLFFVPFYVSRYLFSFFHNDKKNMRQCIEKSSRAWTKVLKAVHTTFPYFNRTNGRDHFGILTLDHVIVTIGLNVPKTKDRIHSRISAQRLQTLIAFFSQLQMTCFKLDLERL